MTALGESGRWLARRLAWLPTLWLALGLLAPLPSHAGAPAEACPPDPAPLSADDVTLGMRQAVDHGLLWRVSKGGRDSWLFGTVHVARKEWMFPGPRLRQAMLASDRIALELDVLDSAIAGRLAALMTGPAPADPLPEDLARRIKVLSEQACAGPQLSTLRPEFQLMLLTVVNARRQGLEPAYAIDGFLAGFARGLRKPVVSLETPEDQLHLILEDDAKQRIEAIDHGLAELESGRALASVQRLAKAWADGDLAELEHYPQWCECMQTDEEKAQIHRLIEDRNAAMADKLQAMHEAGDKVFLAVGALHMIGTEGLPALMAARGFKVERVAWAPAGESR